MEIRISRAQLIYLLFWLVMATGVLTMPLAIARYTIRDGWIAGLMFLIGASITAGICYLYARVFPRTDLTDALIQVFGPFVGRLIGIWFIVWLGVNTALMARQFLAFAEITILPRTPLPFIACAFFVTVVCAVALGLEVIGRFSEFLTPFTVAILAVLIVLAFPDMRLNHLQPILADGWSPILRSAVQPSTSFAFQLVLSLQIFAHLRHPETLARDVFLVGVVITFLLLVVEVLIISILGGAAHYLQYPILEVVRGIQIGRFIQRLDTLYVMGIIAVIFLKVTWYQYLFMSAIQSVLRTSLMSVLVLPTTAVTGAAAIYLWHNTTELSHYMLSVSPAYFTVTLIGIPLAAIIGQRIRGWIGRGTPSLKASNH